MGDRQTYVSSIVDFACGFRRPLGSCDVVVVAFAYPVLCHMIVEALACPILEVLVARLEQSVEGSSTIIRVHEPIQSCLIKYVPGHGAGDQNRRVVSI
jgi:hypothetical protein